jgi:ribosome biogenesis GTPase
MELNLNAKIIKGIGGIYTVRLESDGADKLRSLGISPDEGDTLNCKARGVFRHGKLTPLAGDDVTVRIDTELMLADLGSIRKKDEARAGVMIEEILSRRNELIRPPLANLDLLFIVFSCTKPEPSLGVVDKLSTVAEFKEIEPVIIVTKADLCPDKAEKYAEIYKKCGYTVFIQGIGYNCDDIGAFIREKSDKTAAFAGSSGVGKSTLMNRLFPSLGLATGEVSRKTERGRHTTRHIELYPLDRELGSGAKGYLADTPGFGMLDFVQFDFYAKEDLPYVFREFKPYIGECRYTKCTHTKEDGCAIIEAVRNDIIPAERHQSYVELYDILKKKPSWNN